jgi:hypothetical protein
VQPAANDIAVRTRALNRLHGLVRAGLAEAGLDNATFEKYRWTATVALESMPTAALSRAAAGIIAFRFAKSVKDIGEMALTDLHDHLTDETNGTLQKMADQEIASAKKSGNDAWAAQISSSMRTHPGRAWIAREIVAKFRRQVEENEPVGNYTNVIRTVYLDGNEDGVEPRHADFVRASTYSHEICHGVDGPGMELSSHPNWLLAWKKEIGEVGDEIRLSDYGQTKPEEGFAEFGRTAYILHKDGRAAMAERFPLCAKFFKDRGLWPEGQ